MYRSSAPSPLASKATTARPFDSRSRPSRKARSSKRGVPAAAPAAVVKVAVALDAVDARALAVEGLRAGDVVVPVRERLPPELELDVAVAAVAPHAVGGVDVGPAVVVEVGGDGAPVPAGLLRARARRRVLERVVGTLEQQRVARGHVLAPLDREGQEQPAGQADGNRRVLVEEVPLRVGAGRVEVGPAVAVEVGPRARHAVRARLRSGLLRDVDEALSVFVVVQVLQPEVVGRHQVFVAVLVVVLEERRERPARHPFEAPGLRGVGEVAVAVVQVQKVLAAVVGVEGGVGHLRVVVAGHAHEEIEVPVAVDVGESGRAHVLGNGDPGRGGRLLERAVAAVVEQARGSEGVRHEEVGKPVAVDVARGEAGRGDALGRGLREARPSR